MNKESRSKDLNIEKTFELKPPMLINLETPLGTLEFGHKSLYFLQKKETAKGEKSFHGLFLYQSSSTILKMSFKGPLLKIIEQRMSATPQLFPVE